MMNDPTIEHHAAGNHCDEMKDTHQEAAHADHEAAHDDHEENSGMCAPTCTGPCCSIYLSVGIALAEPILTAALVDTDFVRPSNDRAGSLIDRFPTPPPRA